jgi:ATP-dependent RNA helicase SUPV3L1/SUV3
VLDRQRVAEEVKGLDQPARATLRKYGVRFGAYHVYLPALLKPAPRVLATQLWALKHGGSDTKALESIQQLAGSGRTSIAADASIAKPLYRIAGYRLCGERAVRVDILERLADLIRPALAWRAGAPGAKPPGAIDGFGFTVTAGMMSLAGCSGEDFASVLRSLGYRMEKRPKPVEPPAQPTLLAPAPPAESASDEAVAPASPYEGGPTPEAAPEATETAPQVTEAASEAVEAALETAEAAPVAASSGEAAAAVSAPASDSIDHLVEPVPAEALESVISAAETPALAVSEQVEAAAEGKDVSAVPPPPDAAPQGEVAAAEFIDVWRPGRREEHARRPRTDRAPRQRRPHRRTEASPGATAPDQAAATGADQAAGSTAGSAVSAPAADDARDSRRRRHARPDRSDQPERQPRPDRSPRQGRSEERDRAPRGERPPRGERAERAARGDRPDRDPALRAKYIKGRGDGRDRRDREPDPNSPFAKLAALKEQLEANAKEPR